MVRDGVMSSSHKDIPVLIDFCTVVTSVSLSFIFFHIQLLYVLSVRFCLIIIIIIIIITSTCVLSNSGLSNATSKRPKFVEKRGNYCRDTAKTRIRTPLKSDIYFRFVTETIVD